MPIPIFGIETGGLRDDFDINLLVTRFGFDDYYYFGNLRGWWIAC